MLSTVIVSGIRRPSRRRRLGPVASDSSASQLQPLTQKIPRASHLTGGRSAASASGVPPSAPAILIQAMTQVDSAGVRPVSARAASAPDLLALTITTGPPLQPIARIVSTMTAALASTESLSPDTISRLEIPSRPMIPRWNAKSDPVSGWLL